MSSEAKCVHLNGMVPIKGHPLDPLSTCIQSRLSKQNKTFFQYTWCTRPSARGNLDIGVEMLGLPKPCTDFLWTHRLHDAHVGQGASRVSLKLLYKKAV